MPGLMGESESSAVDFAGKAFIMPRVYQGMGLARGSRARWWSLSNALVGICRFAPCGHPLLGIQPTLESGLLP